MWTYHSPALESAAPAPRPAPPQRPQPPAPPPRPPKPKPAPAPLPSHAVKAGAAHRRRANRLACGMGALYLAGLAAGAVCVSFLSEKLLAYAAYFTQFNLNLHKTGNQPLIFSTSFLSLFVQLTLVLMLGFCVLGCGLIPLFLVVKGAGTGCFFALLYTQVGTVKGLFLQALVFWLPEVLGSLIVILLSAFALRVSLGLAQGCTGQFPPALRQSSKCLVHRYLALCFAAMVPCACSVELSLWFAGIF